MSWSSFCEFRFLKDVFLVCIFIIIIVFVRYIRWVPCRAGIHRFGVGGHFNCFMRALHVHATEVMSESTRGTSAASSISEPAEAIGGMGVFA